MISFIAYIPIFILGLILFLGGGVLIMNYKSRNELIEAMGEQAFNRVTAFLTLILILLQALYSNILLKL